jgi:2',3'-cyclic-nucleotide 2'-phosphodiesterase (5'-nucleotidase family)
VARWAAFINRQKNPDANWLTVEAGNYVDRAGTTGGCSKKCQFMVTSYEGLKYDVLNIARQEVAMGYETLKSMRDTTEESTQYVSSNLIDVNTGKPLFNPFVVRDYGNMRVGIMGLLRPADFPPNSGGLDTVNLRVDDFLATADKYIPTMNRKCNAIIILAELPTADIEALVAAHPEIDLIISTGALSSGEQLTLIGKTQVIGTGSSGYNGHWVSMEFDPAWKDSIAWDSFRDQLGDTYDEKGEWADKLAAFEGGSKPAEKIQPQVNTVTKEEMGVKKPDPQATISSTAQQPAKGK